MCTCETRKSPRSSRKISNILESNFFSNYLCHFGLCSFIFNFNVCLVMWQLKCICFNSFHIYGKEICFYSIFVLLLDVLALTTFEQHFVIHKHPPRSYHENNSYTIDNMVIINIVNILNLH